MGFVSVLLGVSLAFGNSSTKTDKGFFEKAAKSGMKEVAVSEAAMPNLTNPAVKDFAQKMVSEHGEKNQALSALAATKGVTLPTLEPRVAQKWAKNMRNADKDYIDEMVDDHEKAVDLFKKGTKSDDPDVAAFAMKTLPSLEQHLMMAKDLQKSLR